MLGFSIQKILLLIAVIAAVWYGFKMLSRLEQAKREGGKVTDKTDKDSRPDTEDLVPCPVCDAYVPSENATNCGRSDCPY
ncbi:MAG: hypothetical protein R3316_09065 [Rhodovibrionaceae bacterium]|nr:hypothetical protein [Rhodovibrionaceae bacterium]